MKISVSDVATCIALLFSLACEKQNEATSPETASKAEFGSHEHGPPPGGPGGPGGRPPSPPPEAYEACADKQEGDDCAIKHGDRELTGKCAKPPPNAEDERLVCRPEGGPGRPPPGPPPERD